ncbi:MAG: FeoC-like transcriptional regulator [Candidatus Helarchaeota archaeon]
MFKQILRYVEEKKVVNIQDIANFLEKDPSVITDAIKLLTTKGYLKNLNCCATEKEFKFMCIGCPLKYKCHVNPISTYEITLKGIEYCKKKELKK